ncbi:unnamed protein product [Taenia asiatica]|uniref:Skp1_POZ domain-containing protein n=1 Tax=Taenia asiatica TaxID=60517 RepID=A0A0R3WH11_TAEAS|nr:unnamed protein product [Taenia asiatica]
MVDRMEKMDWDAILELALRGLTVKEDAHSASVIVVTPHVATTAPAESVDEDNKVAQDDDDDVDDIVAKALQYVGIKSPTSAMD